LKAKSWVITSAALIAGVRMWMQIRGKTKTPFSEWVVGFGALFVILAVMAEWAPAAAGPLAGTIVVGDFLVNGASLFDDISSVVTGTETAAGSSTPVSKGGGSITEPTPFTTSTSTPASGG